MRAPRPLLLALLAAGVVTAPGAQATTVQNGRIACQGARHGSTDVYTVNPDGSGLTWLTDNDVPDGDPSWSPDGKRLAFESVRELGSEVYVMNANGSGVKMLTRNGSAEDKSTTWSRDGKTIVFQSTRDGDYEVYSMRADGTRQTNLTKNPAFDSLPALSPDGKKIAFNTDRSGANPAATDIYVMDLDGSNLKKITSVPGQNAGPTWSPDGKQIAFHSGLAVVPGGLGISRVNVDGTGLTRLTPPDQFFNAFPTWSPDGKRILWTSNRDGDYEIYTMNASDGGDIKRVTNQPGLDWRCDWTRKR